MNNNYPPQASLCSGPGMIFGPIRVADWVQLEMQMHRTCCIPQCIPHCLQDISHSLLATYLHLAQT